VEDIHVWLRVVVTAEPYEVVTSNAWACEDLPGRRRCAFNEPLKLVKLGVAERIVWSSPASADSSWLGPDRDHFVLGGREVAEG
jgi:hypothetical protein